MCFSKPRELIDEVHVGRLDGKLALSTGTGSGQGRAAALLFVFARVVGNNLLKE